VQSEPRADADTARLPPPARASFAVGELVAGCYEVQRILGAGGMGVVYEAHDRLLNRRVALKVARVADGSLRREAQALAALRHPSMVSIYAMGTHDGVEFLAMELVRGRTLYEYAWHEQQQRRQPLPIAEVLELLIGIAEGLAAIHASGISHRDVKPSNIMLAPGNRIVLMDLGLFKPEFEARDIIAGSPEYMAPEACHGRVAPGAGHLVDLYALGVIAYELCAGVPPFRAASPMETLRLHVEQPVPDVRQARRETPDELAALIVELLAKAPSDRPGNVDEVLGRLRALKTRHERRPPPKRLSVLIVDDDRELAETLSHVVRATVSDAEVTVAPDGEAAFASLLKNMPELLLLDLGMPRMNGLELCMTLRGSGLGRRCRIVAMTGEARARDRELLRQLGVTDCLQKGPSLPRTLIDIVNTLAPRQIR
jgi:eukaryotic-like serine/threonine-protein kinase